MALGRLLGMVLCFQFEDDEPFVFEPARERGAQMLVERPIMSEPPKGRPAKHNERSPRLPKASQLANCRRVVRRRSPIFPVAFEEWHRAPAQGTAGAPLIVVDQNERAVCRNEFIDFAFGQL